jgi:hypothetical protein
MILQRKRREVYTGTVRSHAAGFCPQAHGDDLFCRLAFLIENKRGQTTSFIADRMPANGERVVCRCLNCNREVRDG